MALTYSDPNGTLIIPGAPVAWEVTPSNAGTATSGVVVLVGEAEAGPSYTEEDILLTGYFGTNSKSAVAAKFGSGRLVDAYAMACAPSKDPSVKGAPSRIYLVKTNTGTKAAATLTGTYATLTSKSAGTDGNLINVTVTTPSSNKRTIRIQRRADNVDQSYTIGNNVCFTIGAATSQTCNVVINSTTLTSPGIPAVAANGTATLLSVVAGNKLTINGVDFTAVDSNPGDDEFLITGTDDQDAAALAAAINASTSEGVEGIVTATPSANTVVITADVAGAAGNDITFTQTGDPITVTGDGKLAGGAALTVDPLNITLASYRTLGDLAGFISTKTGWSATAVAMFTQNAPTVLDQGTTDCHDSGGLEVGQIKKDAYEFITAINGSSLVSVTANPTTGLPTNETLFLAGGLKGASTNTNFVDALVQVKRLAANFVVTLVSQDASSDTDTDAASTYTVDSVNAAVIAHASECSQFKNKKARQCFISLMDTFANAKSAAQLTGSARAAMSFEEVMVAGQSGTLAWFQPWAASVIAASMQASAGYRPIFNKSINVYGARAPEDDFVVENVDNVEDAILNGLLCIAPRPDGSMSFVSDQTTYGVDNNAIYNSISAIYNADIISLTVSQKMERAFVGQSFADVSAGVALSYLTSIMAELKRLKLIVASSDAATGWRNAKISIAPPAMLVSIEVKAATGVYFIPINILVSQVTQTASA
jgi:hypothetical protein